MEVKVKVEVKAMACELPATSGVPLSRWSAEELAREAVGRDLLVAQISGTTVWRWLSEDALRPFHHPFHHRSWIFPRDPDFAEKAGRILDLYEGWCNGAPLGAGEYVNTLLAPTRRPPSRLANVAILPCPPVKTAPGV